VHPGKRAVGIKPCRRASLSSRGISLQAGDAGVLIIEALAQTGAFALLSTEENKAR